MEQSPQAPQQASQSNQSPQVIQGPPPRAPSSAEAEAFEFSAEDGGDEVAQALAHAAEQEPAVPAPAVESNAVEPDPEDVSPREMRSAEYAELARERAKLAKREKEFAAREAKVKDFENLSKRDKIAALKAIGYDDPRAFLEDIARNGGQPSPEQIAQMELKAQFDAIKRERDEERSKAAQDRQAAEERQATLTLQNAISTFLKADPKYSKSFIAAAGGDQAIFQIMQNHWNETAAKSRNGQGQVLPFAKAAEMVETNIRNAAKAIASTDSGKALMRELLGVEAPTTAAPGRVSKPAKTTVTPDEEDLDGDALLEKATRFLKNAR